MQDRRRRLRFNQAGRTRGCAGMGSPSRTQPGPRRVLVRIVFHWALAISCQCSPTRSIRSSKGQAWSVHGQLNPTEDIQVSVRRLHRNE